MSAWSTGLSNREGGPNVVDNRCGTDSSVGTWVCEQLHDGRVHPYFACDRNCRSVDQSHSGPETFINDLQILICCSCIY